jgi:hypothetical protein
LRALQQTLKEPIHRAVLVIYVLLRFKRCIHIDMKNGSDA